MTLYISFYIPEIIIFIDKDTVEADSHLIAAVHYAVDADAVVVAMADAHARLANCIHVVAAWATVAVDIAAVLAAAAVVAKALAMRLAAQGCKSLTLALLMS